ncbi:MAG: hypothetical protein HYS21_12605 [Deltaproteobacteria bacterium]|nr:hypothetical protein [Deltaproteobacteria bacterium]
MKSKNIISLFLFLIAILFSGPALSATYTYDNANRLMNIDHGNGIVVNYIYDANGNMISTSVNDVASPTGSVIINSGAVSTTSATVTLTLSASDNSGIVSEMRFSNDNASWAAWESYTTTKAWTLSSGNGTKTVYAEFKDPSGNLSSSTDSITLNISGIDLVVSALSMPMSAQTGAALALSSTVSNNGTGGSANSWLRFYLSADTVIDSSDMVLGSRLVGSIAGGGSSTGITNLTIPLNTVPGTYYIIGVGDSEDENLESNETNNIGVSSGIINIYQ